MKKTKKYLEYFESHFSLLFGIPLIIMLFLIAIIFQWYLKNQYYDFLYDEIYLNDQTLIEVERDNLNSYFKDLIQAGGEIAVNENLYERVASVLQNDNEALARYYLKNDLSSLSNYNNSIAQIAVVTDDELLTQYNGEWGGFLQGSGIWNANNQQTLRKLSADLKSKMEERILQESTYCYAIYLQTDFSDLLTNTGARNPAQRPVLHIAFPLMGSERKFTENNWMVVITYDLDRLDQFFALVENESNRSIIYLSDESNQIVYHADGDQIGQTVDAFETTRDLESMEIPLAFFEWNLHIAIDNEELRNNVDTLYRRGSIVYFLVLTIAVIIVLVLLQRVISPIYEVVSATKRVEEGNLDQKIEVKGRHEIWQLASSYNEMMDSLAVQRSQTEEETAKKILEAERAAEAERETLESQINAHFICNTLGAINYSAIEAGNTEVSGMLRKLSNILRYNFSQSYKNVTIAQEFGWVDQYLYLQRFRLMDVFDYVLSYPEKYDEWPCCKFFLQPFVENSILHGFEGVQSGGLLEVICTEEREILKIVIRDNGNGIEPERLEKLQTMLQQDNSINIEGVGIGIQNAVARMQMFYGPELKITLQSEVGKGTEFCFYLPFPYQMVDEDELEE